MDEFVSVEVLPLKDAVKAREETPQRGASVRRDSTLDKATALDEKETYVRGARSRLGVFVGLAVLLLLYAGWAHITEALSAAMNRAMLPSFDQDRQFPSINLLDYDVRTTFPVFQTRPTGIPRSEMPQFPADRTLNNSVWARFELAVRRHGGDVVRDEVDLRFTSPLQREVSGAIVFNVLLDNIRLLLQSNPALFSEHIILVEADRDLVGRNGERIPAGTMFNLDGHHTNQALKYCARLQHPNLRRGNLHNDDHVCGTGFRTWQRVTVVRGLDPLAVIALALEAGADYGHGMTLPAHVDSHRERFATLAPSRSPPPPPELDML